MTKKNLLNRVIMCILCFLYLVTLIPRSVLAEDGRTLEGNQRDGSEQPTPEYTKDTSDSNNNYYLSSGETIKDLFTFTLSDVPNAVEWLSNLKTFTVLKEYTGEDGQTYIKGYFNVPNLPSLAMNQVISNIGDGYTNQTYKVEDTQWLVQVGGTDNVIKKFGFQIPNYTYMGEYPKAYMSVDNVVPSGFIPSLMKAITALFGASFIDAPTSANYNTINYYNHTYSDNSENVIDFIKDNWIPYFQNYISTEYFSSPEEFRKEYVSKETVTNAKSIIENLSLDLSEKEHLEGEDAYNYAKKVLDNSKYYGSYQQALFGDDLTEPSQAYNQMFSIWRDKNQDKYPKSMSNQDVLSKAIDKNDTSIPDFSNIQVVRKEGNIFSQVVQKYEDAIKSKDQYDAFIEKFNKDDTYRQCLVMSDKPNECVSTRLGKENPVTISVANAYVLSGIYDITSGKDQLTREDTIKLLQKLQDYCGVYYNEVLTNIMTLMQQNAKKAGVEISLSNTVDQRVMPYDIDTMSETDKQVFNIRDPRVKLYKDSMIGSLVTNFKPKFNFGNYIKPQEFLVNLGGRITELSVFFQTIVNFEFLDGLGLSPVELFTSNFATIFYIIMFTILLTRTVKATIDVLKDGSVFKLFSGFIIILAEVGFVAALAANPQESWSNTKIFLNKVMGLGEKISMAQQTELSYMFGTDNDVGVTYYLPYLDLWSTYNTGYGILDQEQFIKKFDTEEVGMFRPKIAERDIQHWSILLADSFNYNGDSNSVYATTNKDGKLVNGASINNNAYRVVDHFNAPRVEYKKQDNGNIKVTVTQNENYNGKFQHGFIDLIAKLLGICNVFFISLIKMLTFLWMWYRIYTFIFHVILEKTRKRSMLDIVSDTLHPVLAMILLGAYTALVISINGYTTGAIAVFVQVGIFLVTRWILFAWSTNKYFPKTLVPLYSLMNFRVIMKTRRDNLEDEETIRTAERAGITLSKEDVKDPKKMRELLFYPDGTPKYPNDIRYAELYKKWQSDQGRKEELGEEISPYDKQADEALMSQLSSNQDTLTNSNIPESEEKEDRSVPISTPAIRQDKIKQLESDEGAIPRAKITRKRKGERTHEKVNNKITK